MDTDRNMGKGTLACLIVFVVLLMGALIAGIIVGITRDDIGLKKDRHGKLEVYIAPLPRKAVPDPGDYPWESEQGTFKYSAVASGHSECSRIATGIMGRHEGNAVDAAVAALFCLGVVNPMFSGIGGGHIMTIHNKNNESKVFIARETAPSGITQDYYTRLDAPSSRTGGSSIAVPGEVQGLYEEWSMYGQAAWEDLVEPSVKLARDGTPVTPLLADIIQAHKDEIIQNNGLRSILYSNGAPLKPGDLLKNTLLAKTLEMIKNSPQDIMDPNSELVQNMSEDMGEDSIITAMDIANYSVGITNPLRMPISKDYTLLTAPAPSSGFIVGLILDILKDYNLNVSDIDHAVQTYQTVVEAFKHAFAQRSKLGDGDNSQLMDSLGSPAMIREFQEKIDETVNSTRPLEFYNPEFSDPMGSGTNSLVIYGPDGTAVAATSAINTQFGSLVFGPKTGIIFNNHMDDFAKPGQTDSWGLPASSMNLPAPGKRPMSSQSPSIVVNTPGDVAMVTAAEGGATMITAIVQTIMKGLHFNWTAQKSVDDPRLHHQLTPEEIQYQPGFSWAVLEGLREKGHNTSEVPHNRAAGQLLSSVQAIRNVCAMCPSALDIQGCEESCLIEAAVDGRGNEDAIPYGY